MDPVPSKVEIHYGAMEDHFRRGGGPHKAVKAHPGAVEGLQASVADFYHYNEDPCQHEKSRIRSSWK
jgi:hypothetical protein